MFLLDVNVLVYAHRTDSPQHREYRAWLETLANGQEPFGLAELVLSGFIRIVTHPRIFNPPSTLEQALSFVNDLRNRTNCVTIGPGPRHWDIFVQVCRTSGAKGNLVPDAYLAALAIESGNSWVTTDRDYSRFVGLTWHHPLDM